jgi:hypothetical protein
LFGVSFTHCYNHRSVKHHQETGDGEGGQDNEQLEAGDILPVIALGVALGFDILRDGGGGKLHWCCFEELFIYFI